MDDATNDNPPPRRRLVPLLGVLDTDSGRFTPYKVVELLPHPDDLLPTLEGKP